MRKLGGGSVVNTLSSEVFSVLQLCAITEPLFPNIRTLDLQPTEESIPSIPLFLSPRTTTIRILFPSLDLPKVMLASMIASLPALCPDLQDIDLCILPDDPMVTAAASAMLLTSNRNTLRSFCVDSPLTEEARGVVYALPDLRTLRAIVMRDTTLPPVVLPNLVDLTITYEHDDDCLRLFRGATLGPLETVAFHPVSDQIGDFLEAFERVALAASVQNTLSSFHLSAPCSWNPNYSSLHSFTQMTYLTIEFSCAGGCFSTVDDGVITGLARTMPKLETLQLGRDPCKEIPTGVTAKGLVTLAHYCLDLHTLRIHFQVASLAALPAISGVTPNTRLTAPRRGCALENLEVGEIPLPEESVLMVSLTLAHIFPHIQDIKSGDGKWDKVVDAIYFSKEFVDYSSEEHPLSTLRSNFIDTSPGAALEDGS